MARIRTIKPEIWTDEDVTECDLPARLLFIGMLNFADDYGNMKRSAKQLKCQVFPADSLDVEPLVEELIANNLVAEYEVDGCTFLHIRGFTKHQRVDKKSAPKHPQPPWQEAEQPVETDTQVDDAVPTNGNGKKPRPPRFTPPTPKEVEEYARSRGKAIDADRFCDFYQAKGWMVGKNKMKDWKAAVRNWLKRNSDQGNGSQAKFGDY